MKIYAANKDVTLDRFVGKDAWVKVQNVYLNSFDYVRVNSAEPTSLGESKMTYRVNRIPVCFVRDGDAATSYGRFATHDQHYREDYLTDSWLFHGDYLIPLEPVEVLSTDELVSMVDPYDEEDDF